jgi:hypothetical protein
MGALIGFGFCSPSDQEKYRNAQSQRVVLPGLLAALHSSLPRSILYCLEFDPNQRGLFRRGNHELPTELAPRQKLDQAGPAPMWREI